MRYWAFISYSSRDARWGRWLHRRLEGFLIPAEFRGMELFDGAVLGSRLRPVFRDRDELAGTSELGPAIRKALEESRYLIVLCSRNAANSEWVNREIEDFRELHGEGRILALILDGVPNASSSAGADGADECFPPALRYPVEPLAGDLRREGDGKERGFLKVLAGVAELDFDALYRRHERLARRRRLAATAVAVGVIASLASLSVVALRSAAGERRALERSDDELYLASVANAGAWVWGDLLGQGGWGDGIARPVDSPVEAMRALAGAPEGKRGWEWNLLAEWVGFAPLEVPVSELGVLAQGVLAGSGLEEVARGMLDGSLPRELVRAAGGVVVEAEPYGSRGGAVVVVRRELGEPALAEYRTVSYGTIYHFWLSADGSVLLVLSDPMQTEAELLGDGEDGGGLEPRFYVLPVPLGDHFVPPPVVVAAEGEGAGEPGLEEAWDYAEETFEFGAFPNGVFLAGSWSYDEVEAYEVIEGGAGGLRLTSVPGAFRIGEAEAAVMGLPEGERPAAMEWLFETTDAEDPDAFQPRFPTRVHLDVNWASAGREVLSVSRGGEVSLTPLVGGGEVLTFPLPNERARWMWSGQDGAFDRGGVFSRDGRRFLLCPYEGDQAGWFDAATLELLFLIGDPYEGDPNTETPFAVRSNVKVGRPAPSVWGVSPLGRFAWLSSYDAGSDDVNFGLAELEGGRVVSERPESGILSVGWTRDERYFGTYNARTELLRVVEWPGGGDEVARLAWRAGSQPASLLQEFSAVEGGGRVIVGPSVRRRSDFREVLRLGKRLAVSEDGSWAVALLGFEGEAGDEGGRYARLRLMDGLGMSVGSSLAEKIRASQLGWIAGSVPGVLVGEGWGGDRVELPEGTEWEKGEAENLLGGAMEAADAGHADEARRLLRLGLVAGGYRRDWARAGWVYLRLGDDELALRCFAKAWDGAARAELLAGTAIAAWRTGRRGGAVAALERYRASGGREVDGGWGPEEAGVLDAVSSFGEASDMNR